MGHLALRAFTFEVGRFTSPSPPFKLSSHHHTWSARKSARRAAKKAAEDAAAKETAAREVAAAAAVRDAARRMAVKAKEAEAARERRDAAGDLDNMSPAPAPAPAVVGLRFELQYPDRPAWNDRACFQKDNSPGRVVHAILHTVTC